MLQTAVSTYYGVGKLKFAKMLAVGLQLVALSYGAEMLLTVAAATSSMNIAYCCDCVFIYTLTSPRTSHKINFKPLVLYN